MYIQLQDKSKSCGQLATRPLLICILACCFLQLSTAERPPAISISDGADAEQAPKPEPVPTPEPTSAKPDTSATPEPTTVKSSPTPESTTKTESTVTAAQPTTLTVAPTTTKPESSAGPETTVAPTTTKSESSAGLETTVAFTMTKSEPSARPSTSQPVDQTTETTTELVVIPSDREVTYSIRPSRPLIGDVFFLDIRTRPARPPGYYLFKFQTLNKRMRYREPLYTTSKGLHSFIFFFVQANIDTDQTYYLNFTVQFIANSKYDSDSPTWESELFTVPFRFASAHFLTKPLRL